MATATMSAPKKGTAAKKNEIKEWDGEGKKPKSSAEEGNSERQRLIQQAVEGTLKPREDFEVDKSAYTAKDDKGRPKGRPLGKTTGLNILMAWCYIFIKNEKASKNQRLTDEGISKFMKSEFPGRETPAFDHPQTCRRDYNEGRFTAGAIPKVQSRRYDENGEVVEGRGPRKAKEVVASKKATGEARSGPKRAGGKPAAKELSTAPKETVNA